MCETTLTDLFVQAVAIIQCSTHACPLCLEELAYLIVSYLDEDYQTCRASKCSNLVILIQQEPAHYLFRLFLVVALYPHDTLILAEP